MKKPDQLTLPFSETSPGGHQEKADEAWSESADPFADLDKTFPHGRVICYYYSRGKRIIARPVVWVGDTVRWGRRECTVTAIIGPPAPMVVLNDYEIVDVTDIKPK